MQLHFFNYHYNHQTYLQLHNKIQKVFWRLHHIVIKRHHKASRKVLVNDGSRILQQNAPLIARL